MTISATNTPIDMCAKALVCIGLKPINTFVGTDDKIVTCATIYPMVRDEIMSIYPWRFTTVKKQISRLTAPPANEWKYAFQLPSGRMGGPIAVFNSGEEGAKPIKGYDVYQDHLYTNEEKIWIDYTAPQDEAKWPPYVITLAIFVIASRIAEPLTDDSSKTDKWHALAYGPPSANMQGGYFSTAKGIDARQRPSQEISGDFSLVDVRN